MQGLEMIREPRQERAKARYDAILEATKGLILEKGSAQLKVKEIATRAGSTTGAIYRYFPSKHAIIHALLAEYFQTFERLMPTTLIEIDSLDQLVAVMLSGYDAIFELYQQEPVLRDILISGAADKRIQEYDLEDSRKRAKAIFISARHLFPRENWGKLNDYLFLLLHISTPTIHMILSLEPEKQQQTIALSKLWATREMFEQFL